MFTLKNNLIQVVDLGVELRKAFASYIMSHELSELFLAVSLAFLIAILLQTCFGCLDASFDLHLFLFFTVSQVLLRFQF